MALTAGTRVGPYEILARIGADEIDESSAAGFLPRIFTARQSRDRNKSGPESVSQSKWAKEKADPDSDPDLPERQFLPGRQQLSC